MNRVLQLGLSDRKSNHYDKVPLVSHHSSYHVHLTDVVVHTGAVLIVPSAITVHVGAVFKKSIIIILIRLDGAQFFGVEL